MLELRKAAFADFPVIAKIHGDNWKQTYRGIYSDHFLDHHVEQDRLSVWQERLQNAPENQHVTVAVLNQKIVGFSCLYLEEDRLFGSYLDNLHVALGHQKAGLGRVLLRECAGYIAAKSNHPNLYLWVYKANENARKVYEHLGAILFETTTKETKDGLTAEACRYCWNDVKVLLGQPG